MLLEPVKKSNSNSIKEAEIEEKWRGKRKSQKNLLT